MHDLAAEREIVFVMFAPYNGDACEAWRASDQR